MNKTIPIPIMRQLAIQEQTKANKIRFVKTGHTQKIWVLNRRKMQHNHPLLRNKEEQAQLMLTDIEPKNIQVESQSKSRDIREGHDRVAKGDS